MNSDNLRAIGNEENSGCCGGPASNPEACCRKDENAKAIGQPGCGCQARETKSEKAPQSACCA